VERSGRRPLAAALVDYSLNYGRAQVAELLASVAPFAVVVDVGAGPGEDLRAAHAVCPDAELWGADLAPVSQLFIRGLTLDLERDRLPFGDACVDVVIANQVIEHTKEVFWIFHEMTRVLRPGGHLIVGAPNLASLHNRILLLAGRQPTSIRTASAHVRGTTVPDLADFIDACFPEGLRICAVRGANFYPLPPGLARPAARAFPSLAWGIIVLLRKERRYTSEFLDFPAREALETPFWTGPSTTLDEGA